MSLPMREPEQATDLGTCCSCQGNGDEGNPVRTLIQLHKKAPLPGRGWGCVQCGLPCDGAVAVLCDDCFNQAGPIRFACRGYPAIDGRVPLTELCEVHAHNWEGHPELADDDDGVIIGEPTCRRCGCTDLFACEGGCHWVEPDLCSNCV